MTTSPPIQIHSVQYGGSLRRGFTFPIRWSRQLLAVGFLWVMTVASACMGWSYTHAGHLPLWYHVHEWRGLLIGVLATPVLVCISGWVTWSLFRRESRFTLLPEGVLRPGPGGLVLIPWREITAIAFVEVQSGNRRQPSLSIHVRDIACLRLSAMARGWMVSMTDPLLLSISLVPYMTPSLVGEAVKHYVDEGGKTATIGTTWGLELLKASLLMGEAGEPPACIRRMDVPYLDIPSLAATFPRSEGEKAFGVVLSAGGISYERPEPYCIPWLHIARIALMEKNGMASLHVGEMTRTEEIAAFLESGRLPGHILWHSIPLTGYAVPSDMIEAIVRYYRFGQGDTIPIGVASNLAKLYYDFGLGSRAALERVKLEEWLVRVAHDPVGLDFDDTDWSARKWALQAPYEELAVMLELLKRGPRPDIDEKDNEWGDWDLNMDLILSYWARRDLPRFQEMTAPYMHVARVRPILLCACSRVGPTIVPWLCSLIEEMPEWSEDDAELLADALFETGGAQAPALLQRLRQVRPELAGYLERVYCLIPSEQQ